MDSIQIGNLRFVVAPERQGLHRKERSVSRSKPKVKRRRLVSQAKQISARAKLYGLENVRKVGDGGLITQPVETKGWLVMPPDMYDGIIPRPAWEAAETLTKGIAIKGFLIADDKRAIEQRERRQEMANRLKSVNWTNIASTTGRVAGVIAVVGLVISFVPAVLGLALIGVALTYDPLLIAVTEDDQWICVYEWWH